MPTETKYFETENGVAIGGTVLIKDDSGKATFSDSEITSPKTLKKLITAVENTFNNSTNGFTATNVQAAIEESKSTAEGKARFVVICGYGGQGKGQYFEFFKGLDSNQNPFIVSKASNIKEVSMSFSATPTGTIKFYKNGVAIYTFTVSAVTHTFTELTFSFAVGDKFSVLGENTSSTLPNPEVSIFFTVI